MVASTADILKQQAAGKYTIRTTTGIASNTNTNANANSGYTNLNLGANQYNTTFPNTIGSVDGANVSSELLFFNLTSSGLSNRNGGIGRIYKVGTCNFTALGDCFTHDAATFPLLRTEMGVSNAPQAFIPILQMSATTSGTIIQFQIRNSTSTTGYVNQNGTTVVGTKTFILPSATTTSGSTFFLRLNDGDYACRDIQQITCTVAGTTGLANIWLVEDLGIGQSGITGPGITDHLYGSGLRLTQATACTATSGTPTTSLIPYSFGNTGSSTTQMMTLGILP